MELEPFLLERWMRAYQFASPPIRFDLASSTGPKWTVDAVLDLAGDETRTELGRLKLKYAPPNGSIELRQAIAGCHAGDPDSVVVTTGASEALSMLLCLTAETGGNVVLPSLVYPAIPALARAWGQGVKYYAMRRDDDFEHRAEEIVRAVDAGTRLVLVNSPHNPTGAVIDRCELVALAEALADRAIPLAVDEVYHPLYFASPGETAAGLANTIVIGDLSKAYSLSGLRVGWLVDTDSERRQRLIDARGYFTVSNSVVTEFLAAVAMRHRGRLLRRLERVARSNLTCLDDFVGAHGDVLGWVRPVGGTTAFPWLVDVEDARPLCESLAAAGVLTAPGECFDAPDHFRIGFAAEATGFAEALTLFDTVLAGNQWR